MLSVPTKVVLFTFTFFCDIIKHNILVGRIMNMDFWIAVDELVSSGKIVIDRPKGSTHPRFPHCRYEVDYGYLENSTSMDGSGIDV